MMEMLDACGRADDRDLEVGRQVSGTRAVGVGGLHHTDPDLVYESGGFDEIAEVGGG
jgi:hypothetical protein